MSSRRKFVEIPAISDVGLSPEVVRILRPLRELAIQMRSELDTGVLRRDDIDQLGLTSALVDLRTLPRPKRPALTKFSAIAGGARFDFDRESLNFKGFEAVEIYRSETDAFAAASYCGETSGLTFNDFTGQPGKPFFYWFRSRNTAKTRSEPNTSAVSIKSGALDWTDVEGAGRPPDDQELEVDYIDGVPVTAVIDNATLGAASDYKLDNPRFESGDIGWTRGTGWTIAEDGATARRGTWRAAKAAGTASSLINNKFFAVEQGDCVTSFCFVRSTGGADGSARVRVAWYDSSDTLISTTSGNVVTAPQGSFVKSRVISAAAPANAVSGVILCYIDGHTTGTWYVDDFQAQIVPRTLDEVADGASFSRILGTELTAGVHIYSARVSAGLDSSGDLNRNILSSRADSSNMLRRTAGGLFTGELNADLTSTHTSNDTSNVDSTAASTVRSRANDGWNLTQVASNVRLADARNSLQVASSNVGSRLESSPLSAADVGSDVTISIAANTQYIGSLSVSNNSGSVTGRAFEDPYDVYHDDANLAGGAVTYAAPGIGIDATAASEANARVYDGYIFTPADGGGGTSGSGGGGIPP